MRQLLATAIAVMVFTLIGFGAAGAQSLENYVWGAACKDCHAAQHTAWEKTKHSRAITRLSGGDREAGGMCIGCHVTPAGASLLEKNVNADIQCEGCHGPGKAHIEAAAGGAAKPGKIVRKPAESVCVQCHNTTSPHFKFFSYAAMVTLVHAVPK